MTLEPGATVLHYRIVEKIGEGGMGIVWKALDTTLDRTVAIKLLPASFGEDPDRLARFEREAKSLASLNHPNVASLFGLHEVDGARFITMEYIEGEDLAKRIKRCPLPVDEAVEIAIGIAEALSAAHAQGIVHRDLKPANVLLDADGTPKVLDFGLAKTAMPEAMSSGGSDPSASPTITSLGTVAGVLLGTAAYMSPEQARGKSVDKRADTWALGCIVFQMLTGAVPFPGDTISDTLASVLKTEPDWGALPASTPSPIVEILRRSLAKNVRDRWQDAGDLRYALERAFDPAEASVAAVTPGPSRKLAPVAIAMLLGGVLLGAAVRHALIRDTASATPLRGRTVSEISTEPGIAFGVKSVDLALSHDGQQLAYSGIGEDGISRLYVRPLTGGGAKALPGTDGAREPFWSPDGREVAFHTDQSIRRIGLNDRQPRTIADLNGNSGTWNQDGLILYCKNSVGTVQTIDIETGKQGALPYTEIGEGSSGCDSVSFLADGRHFLFEDRESGHDSGVFVASLDTEKVTRLTSLKTNAMVSDGHVLFHDGPQLMALRIDPRTYEPDGEPFVIADPVFELNFPFHALFAAARDRRRLVYLEGSGESLRTELVWFDRAGDVVERTGIVGDLYNPRLSRDARKLLLDVSTYETEGDIWLFDLERGSERRLTDHAIDESQPAWSPDEKTVYFFRVPDLYKIDLVGNAEPTLMYDAENPVYTSHSSIDGTVVFTEQSGNQQDIGTYDPESGVAVPWLVSPSYEENPEFSPDGKWLAYESDESGRDEIYIDRFPERSERFQVSRDGGTRATWRGDGKEIYYVSPRGEIVAVPVDLESDRRPIGTPQPLFRPKIRRDMFTPHPDGQRFLVIERLDPEIHRAILVDDWRAP
jgi:serine/threonine protein kinase